jgi:hypothetical protein
MIGQYKHQFELNYWSLKVSSFRDAVICSTQVAAFEPSDYLGCSSQQNQMPKLMKRYLLQLALCDDNVKRSSKNNNFDLGFDLWYLSTWLNLVLHCDK